MKTTALLCIALLLASCSAEKRLNALLANHPEFTRKDTITVRDTVYFDRVEQHVTEVFLPGDTVRIDTGRLHVRVVRLPGDSVFVEGRCDPDTVVVTNEVVVDRILPTKTVHKMPWFGWLIIGLLALALVVLAILRFFDPAPRK